MANSPLSGIRVAEFSTGAVIPLCGELMAVMGAEVIRVESHRKPQGGINCPIPRGVIHDAPGRNELRPYNGGEYYV